jgi:hypothetical protein
MGSEINIKITENRKELYLFGIFEASWDKSVSDMDIIIPYAVRAALNIGKKEKENEIKKALGL